MTYLRKFWTNQDLSCYKLERNWTYFDRKMAFLAKWESFLKFSYLFRHFCFRNRILIIYYELKGVWWKKLMYREKASTVRSYIRQRSTFALSREVLALLWAFENEKLPETTFQTLLTTSSFDKVKVLSLARTGKDWSRSLLVRCRELIASLLGCPLILQHWGFGVTRAEPPSAAKFSSSHRCPPCFLVLLPQQHH